MTKPVAQAIDGKEVNEVVVKEVSDDDTTNNELNIIKDDELKNIKEDHSISNDGEDGFDHEVPEDNLMLTTVDNPYNPKTDYFFWRKHDHEYGYFTEEYIARLIVDEPTYDAEDDFLLNSLTTKVINDILENDDLELYRLI